LFVVSWPSVDDGHLGAVKWRRFWGWAERVETGVWG
jgi:hypothetical protein